jgi:hypothetical protein
MKKFLTYCDTFAESRGTLLGNGISNASPRQPSNRGIPGSGVSYAVQRQANSDGTIEHVTLRHAHQQRNGEEMFSVLSVPRLYKEDQLPWCSLY